MLCGFRDRHIFIFLCVVDINNRFLVHALFVSFQNRQQIFFPVISNQQIYRSILTQLSLCCLYIAAHRYHQTLRILFLRPVQHLTGLPIRDIRYRAGIDNIDICFLLKGYNLIACLFQHLLHALCLICVYLAAQVMKRYFFHFPTSFQKYVISH